MFGYTKRRNSDTLGDWYGCPQLQRAFNYGEPLNIRCFVAKWALSRVTRTWGGGVAKKWRGGGGGGSGYPPKMMTSFMNSPQLHTHQIVINQIFISLLNDWKIKSWPIEQMNWFQRQSEQRRGGAESQKWSSFASCWYVINVTIIIWQLSNDNKYLFNDI